MTRHDGVATPESTTDDSSRLCRSVTEPGGENEKPENFLEEPREVIRRRRTDRRSHASQRPLTRRERVSESWTSETDHGDVS